MKNQLAILLLILILSPVAMSNSLCLMRSSMQRGEDRTSSYIGHKVHEYGHRLNAGLKDATNGKVRLDPIYGDKRWSSDVDRKRAEFHKKEAAKK